jgi:hypothetical protein
MLEEDGFSVVEAANVDAALRVLKELSPIFGDGLKDQAAAVWD